MVIADVLVHQAFQMAFIESDNVVEQIAAAVADPTLGDTVLPRTAETGSLGPNAEALYRVDHFFIELCAATKDQVAGRRIVRERLAQLLNDPGAGRVFGHIAVKDAPPIMRNDEEAIQHAEGQRRHGEEIHCRDGFTMIAQKGRPSLCRLRTPRCLSRRPRPITQSDAARKEYAWQWACSGCGHLPWRDRSKLSASLRLLKVVDLFLCDSKFRQNLFVRNGLVELQPFICFRERFFLFCGDWFVVERSVGDSAGDGIEHDLQEADDSGAWPGDMRSINSYACCFVYLDARAIFELHGILP